ncbi:MAG: RsmD family RNA methyltransferase [Propionibacteriaceae bacterium]|jgi:16S rRNA (guanine966-N2)-methyltransferase|nr:RsmD family RNA methyltransferase [Propionibacteriaceae bacterium]
MSRIIAGRFASRRVATPSGDQTRPTADRVRESVFSQLASWLAVADRSPDEQLADRRFLDLYAGSGAVGLEAVSRGATACWVEKDPRACRVIQANLRDLGVAGRVVRMDVTAFLRQPPTSGGFDVVWADPPYAVDDQQIAEVVDALSRPGWVAPYGWVLVERSRRTSAVEFPQCFDKVGQRRLGDTIVYYARRGDV